jgi:Long-chain acyl-CoA synthetases (AMP-forming)
LVIPSFTNLKDWVRQQDMEYTTNEQMIHNARVQDFYKNEVDHYNKLFNHVEQIKKFELLPNEWSVEGGEMTPKLSLKRKVIMEKYKDGYGRIYA